MHACCTKKIQWQPFVHVHFIVISWAAALTSVLHHSTKCCCTSVWHRESNVQLLGAREHRPCLPGPAEPARLWWMTIIIWNIHLRGVYRRWWNRVVSGAGPVFMWYNSNDAALLSFQVPHPSHLLNHDRPPLGYSSYFTGTKMLVRDPTWTEPSTIYYDSMLLLLVCVNSDTHNRSVEHQWVQQKLTAWIRDCKVAFLFTPVCYSTFLLVERHHVTVMEFTIKASKARQEKKKYWGLSGVPNSLHTFYSNICVSVY